MEEQTVNNQVQEQPVSPVPVNKKPNHWIIAAIILAVIVFLPIIFILFLNSQKSITTPPSSISPTPSPITDETANWKTYTNAKYNYQFKYPNKDWTFDSLVPPKYDEDIQTFDSISLIKLTTMPNKYVDQTVWWMRFFVSVQPNPNQLTPKELYYFGQYTKDIPAGLSTSVPFGEQYLRDLRNRVSREVEYPQGVENTTFLGYPALRETYEKWGSLTFVKDSFMFVMSWSIEDGKETAENAQWIFDQILSTFKFLDQEQVVCTQDAKLCPDGKTYVGRQGPNCEFAKCP